MRAGVDVLVGVELGVSVYFPLDVDDGLTLGWLVSVNAMKVLEGVADGEGDGVALGPVTGIMMIGTAVLDGTGV